MIFDDNNVQLHRCGQSPARAHSVDQVEFIGTIHKPQHDYEEAVWTSHTPFHCIVNKSVDISHSVEVSKLARGTDRAFGVLQALSPSKAESSKQAAKVTKPVM